MRRRQFVWGAAAAGIGAGVAAWLNARGRIEPVSSVPSLKPDPQGVLDLLPGFSYTVVQRAGDPMDDGLRVPALADGMACFSDARGRWVLMRNHELDVGMHPFGAFAGGSLALPEAYDPAAPGGVTRVVLDPETLAPLSSNLVLTGTARNCAGGPSPWGWLSCEESLRPGHGYVFLCDIEAEHVQAARPIPAYGRFNHEAVAIDPTTHTAYLSEDNAEGCFYRMRPADRERPFEGRLEALALDAGRSPDTGRMSVGAEVPVHWVPVGDPTPETGTSTREQAQAEGAALIRRGEGVWFDQGSVFFTATIGGPIQGGQIFELKLSAQGDRLRLVARSEDPKVLDMPDNLTVTPWGDLLVCEDGGGTNFMRLVTRAGAVLPFARNARSLSELAGVCFSPDGHALFVNLQLDGWTLVVTGPFERLARGQLA